METEAHECSKETYIAVVQVAKQIEGLLRAAILFILSRSRISQCFLPVPLTQLCLHLLLLFVGSLLCYSIASANLVASSIILRKFPMASA